MAQHFEDFCEDKARAGDGQFAVAYAIMRLVKEHERLATKVGYLGFDSPGTMPVPGALENIGMQLRDISTALQPLLINASVDVNDNG